MGKTAIVSLLAFSAILHGATAWVSPGGLGTGSTAATITIAYTPHAIGNVIILDCAEYRSTTQATAVNAPSDTAGNTWSNVSALITDGITGSTSAGRAKIFSAVSKGTSSTTITCNFSGGAGTANTVVMVDEFSGANGANDGQNSAAGNSASPSPGSVTPGQNNDILWAMCIGNCSSSPGGWTTRQNNSGFVTSTQQLSGGAGGSQSITYSQPSQGWLAAIVALSPSPFPRTSIISQGVMRAAFWSLGAIGSCSFRRRSEYVRAYLRSLPRRGAMALEDSRRGEEWLNALMAEPEFVTVSEAIQLEA